MKYLATGKIVGALVGLPAGVFGAAFGLLVGALVDQAVKLSRERSSVVRILDNPHSLEATDALPVETLVLILAFTVHGDLSDAARETLISKIEEHFNPNIRRLRELNRLAADGRGISMHTNSADLTVLLDRRLADDDRESVVDLLISVAHDSKRVWPIAERLRVSEATYRRLCDRYRVLDSEACVVLGISVDSPLEDVKRVYRTLASQFHPDASAGLDDMQRLQAAEAYIRVQSAYQRIMRDFES